MLSKRPARRPPGDASAVPGPGLSGRRGEISHIQREIFRDPVVLVVERDPLLRWAMYETLVSAGFHVVAAPGSSCAEAWLQEIDQEVALALINDDAWPLAPPARAVLEARWPSLPVVVMLHGENPVIEARAREHGATEVLVKPFDLPDLVRLVERMTGVPRAYAAARPSPSSSL